MWESLFNFFDVQQNIVTKLEMLGQEDKAIEKLKNAAEEAKKKSLPLYEHEYQMLLVELYIYKVFITNSLIIICSKCKTTRKKMNRFLNET